MWIWVFYAMRTNVGEANAVVFLLGPAALLRAASEYAEGAIRRQRVVVSSGAMLSKAAAFLLVLGVLCTVGNGSNEWLLVMLGASCSPFAAYSFDITASGGRLRRMLVLNVLSAALGLCIYYVLSASVLVSFGVYLCVLACGSAVELVRGESFARTTDRSFWWLSAASFFAALPRLMDIPLSVGWSDREEIARNAFVMRVANQAARVPTFLNSYWHVARLGVLDVRANLGTIAIVGALAALSGAVAFVLLRGSQVSSVLLGAYVALSVVFHFLGEAHRMFAPARDNFLVTIWFSVVLVACGAAARLGGLPPLEAFVLAYVFAGGTLVAAWGRLLSRGERAIR